MHATCILRHLYTGLQLTYAVLLPDKKDANEESSDDEDDRKKCGWEKTDQSFQTLLKFMERNEASLALKLLQKQLIQSFRIIGVRLFISQTSKTFHKEGETT